MQTPTVSIKPFIVGTLPKEKYSDPNEFANDLAAVLAISEDYIKVNLIALSDLKGDKGDKGKQGAKGDAGGPGPVGAAGPTGQGLVWRSAWVTGTNYDINDLAINDDIVYISTVTHLSATDTEPGTGVDWATTWEVFHDLTASSLTYSLETWTPVVTAASGTAPSFSTATGRATRIGREFFSHAICANITGGTIGAGAGQLSISLDTPVSATHVSTLYPQVRPVGSYYNNVTTYPLYASIVASASTALLWKQVVAGATVTLSPLTGADLDHVDARQIRFSMNYTID